MGQFGHLVNQGQLGRAQDGLHSGHALLTLTFDSDYTPICSDCPSPAARLRTPYRVASRRRWLTMVTLMLPSECCRFSNISAVQDRVHLRLGFGVWTPQQPQK